MYNYYILLLTFCYYQVQESDEARKKFSNAKSISSAQYFGDQNKATDFETQATLQKFSVCSQYTVCSKPFTCLCACYLIIIFLLVGLIDLL